MAKTGTLIGQEIACWRCHAVLVCGKDEKLPEHKADGKRCPCSGTPFPRCNVQALASGDERQSALTPGWVAPERATYEAEGVRGLSITFAYPAYYTGKQAKCDCPRHNPSKYGIPE